MTYVREEEGGSDVTKTKLEIMFGRHRLLTHGKKLLQNSLNGPSRKFVNFGDRKMFHGSSMLLNKHRDYYEVLGVDRNVDQSTLKKRYRELAKKYHPDSSKEEDATAKFQEITHAYEVLSDPEKRKAYDNFGPDFEQAGGMGGGGFGGGGGNPFAGFAGFEDIFGAGPGAGGGGFGGFGGQPHRHSPNVTVEVELSFMEAIRGCEKTVTYRADESCSSCGGNGVKAGEKPKHKKCNACNGMGVRTQSMGGLFQVQVTCEVCGGRGQSLVNPCNTCNGIGVLENQVKQAHITIPPGVDNNNFLHVPNKGHDPPRGKGRTGSLEVHISVAPHAYFKRRESNIFCNVNVTLAQALLGEEKVPVKTLDGEVDLKIPPLVKNNEKVRLRNRGVPNPNNPSEKGDQFVYFKVDMPTSLTDRQRELMKEFREEEKNKNNKTKSEEQNSSS